MDESNLMYRMLLQLLVPQYPEVYKIVRRSGQEGRIDEKEVIDALILGRHHATVMRLVSGNGNGLAPLSHLVTHCLAKDGWKPHQEERLRAIAKTEA